MPFTSTLLFLRDFLGGTTTYYIATPALAHGSESEGPKLRKIGARQGRLLHARGELEPGYYHTGVKSGLWGLMCPQIARGEKALGVLLALEHGAHWVCVRAYRYLDINQTPLPIGIGLSYVVQNACAGDI
jgi:hypothetical protein